MRKTGRHKKCIVCENMFYVIPCQERKGRGKACSRKCRDKYLTGRQNKGKGIKRGHRKETPLLNCIICKNKYYVPRRRRAKSKYCSRKCWDKRNPPEKRACIWCKKDFLTYQRKQKFCSPECKDKGRIGSKVSELTKQKMSKAKQGYMPVNIYQKGEKHFAWKKDRSMIGFTDTPEYNIFRLKILARDNYACQKCGIRGAKGIRPILEIHHIKPRSIYPELAMEENNVQTLCKECHKKTDSYLKNKFRMKKFDPNIQIRKV